MEVGLEIRMDVGLKAIMKARLEEGMKSTMEAWLEAMIEAARETGIDEGLEVEEGLEARIEVGMGSTIKATMEAREDYNLFKVYLKTKNIKETFDNVDYCSQKVKNGYANFGLLYSNASDIDDKSIYTSTFIKTIHELRNVNNSSIPDEEAAQIYSELMKFYSYDVILDDDYLREELRFFIDNVNNHYRDSMYKDYKENYTEYEKRKIQKVVKADTIKVSKKRI